MVRAVIFDIGGVLELTPPTGFRERWEKSLGLGPGELDRRMDDVWRGGTLGTLSEPQVHSACAEGLGLSAQDLQAFMADFWAEYLGSANTELIDYFRPCAPATAPASSATASWARGSGSARRTASRT